jgi:hypothetical protein
MNTAQIEHALTSLVSAKTMILDQTKGPELIGIMNMPPDNEVLLGIRIGPVWTGKEKHVDAWKRFADATRKYRAAAVAFEKDIAKQD